MSDEEKGLDSGSYKLKSSKYPKDKWDKAEIIFKFLSGVVAAVLIATLGIIGNQYLQKKQKADSDIKLYTQLLSNKETAENTLRKDMFGQILQSFLKPRDAEKSSEQSILSRIREMRLSLELLSRNFHESLDMKPLFKHLLMEIVRGRKHLMRCSNKLGKCKEKMTEDAKQACSQAETMINEKLNIKFTEIPGNNFDKQISQEVKKINRLYGQYDRELDLLVGVAKRVAWKQREVLEEVAGEIKLEIPIKGQPASNICTSYRPIDWLPKDEGICKTQDGGKVRVTGVEKEGILVINQINGEKKNPTRYFKMKVRYAYPKWKMVYVEILTCREKKGCEERTEDDPEKDKVSFWLEYFDFPLVDNTYLNSKERYSVILEGFKEGPAGEEEKAEITLFYYPASYAGLKEKSFYNNKLMQALLRSELFQE